MSQPSTGKARFVDPYSLEIEGNGRSERTWILPESVDLNKIEANFNNGVLEIRLPGAEKLLPKKIEVKRLELAA